jgi:nucleoside recognition membrane protein YjiH
MSDDITWLIPSVAEYIQNNSGNIDTIDVHCHFRHVGHLALIATNQLIEEGRVEKRVLYVTKHKLYFIK